MWEETCPAPRQRSKLGAGLGAGHYGHSGPEGAYYSPVKRKRIPPQPFTDVERAEEIFRPGHQLSYRLKLKF